MCGIVLAPRAHPSQLGDDSFGEVLQICLFRRLRRFLLVLVTNFVESDINDVSVEFRPRWQRKRQAFFDIDKWNVCLGRWNGDRNPFELGDDGLRLRSLAYDRIAQGNVDLTRPAHRSEYDAPLNAHLDA